MSKTSLNFWIDALLFAAMIGLVATGALMHFVLPSGTGRFLVVLGLSRHDYGVIHAWLAVAVVLLTIVHVALHWEWVCCFVGRSCGQEKPCRSSQIRWGIAFLVVLFVLLAGFTWWASTRVHPTDGVRGGRGGASMERRLDEGGPRRMRGGVEYGR